MSNQYGLAVHNELGQILFDSRKQMTSYVVSDYGTASSVNANGSDLVFVKGSASVSSSIIYGVQNLNGTYAFFALDPSTGVTSSVSLPYLVATRSADVTPDPSDTYGLLVKSPDGTVQFDSRSIQSDSHFKITANFPRLTLPGDANSPSSPTLITDSAEYVEIRRYSEFFAAGSSLAITGIQFFGTNGNQPKFWSYFQITDPTLGAIRTYSDNRKAVLVCEQDV